MSTEWEDVKKYVEPIAAEIDLPNQVLAELTITLYGDGEENVACQFPFADRRLPGETVAALYEWAARVLATAAEHQRRS